MTKRRSSTNGDKFTTKTLDTYKRARAIFDAEGETEEFQKLQGELNVMLDRTAPWLTDIFDTVDCGPPVWLVERGGEQLERWRDAETVLAVLEDATEDA
jgi:hypothetical protein